MLSVQRVIAGPWCSRERFWLIFCELEMGSHVISIILLLDVVDIWCSHRYGCLWNHGSRRVLCTVRHLEFLLPPVRIVAILPVNRMLGDALYASDLAQEDAKTEPSGNDQDGEQKTRKS